jgi:hypothetical protein
MTVSNEELLTMASEFLVYEMPGSGAYNIRVARMRQMDGSIKWAVRNTFGVYSKEEQDFVAEHIPSSRTDEILADTRFDDLQEAIAIARKEAEPLAEAYENWEKHGKGKTYIFSFIHDARVKRGMRVD